jgi:glycolate oxidase iron-sulfur subunit
MALIKAVLDKKLPLSTIVRDRLAACTTCLACEAACASGVRVTGIIQAVKEQAAEEAGIGLVQAMIGRVLKSDWAMGATVRFAPLALHYGRGAIRGGKKDSTKYTLRSREHSQTLGAGRVQSTEGKKDQGRGAKGTIVFYPGCAIRYFQPDIGAAAVRVLNAIGYEVVVPEGLKCCGRPLLSLGDRKGAEELAVHNSKLLAGLEADALVTACASCGLTFKREYPKLLPPGAKGPVILDIHEFLFREFADIRFAPINKSVTVHDPCHLGRGQGLSGTVRDVLRRVPGITLIEMNEADRCCGFGGVMRVTHRTLSNGIAEAKVRNILAAGAEIVATGCPGCRMQIAEALRREGANIEVLHPIQILEEALENAEL